MIAWKKSIWILLLSLSFTTLKSQDDGDWINRLKTEPNWTPYRVAIQNPDKVTKLYIKNKAPLDLVALRTFKILEGLIIADSKIADLLWLEDFPNLKVFECQGNGLRSLEGIHHLTVAEEISIKSNFITDLSPLKDLTELTMLNLYENDIVELAPIAHMDQITHLDLAKNKIKTISVLEDWTDLVYFSVYSCYELHDVDAIAGFRKVESLNLSFLDVQEFDVHLLDSLAALQFLCLQGMLNDNAQLEPISHITTLKSLTMGKNDGISDLSHLSSLQDLEYLDIHSNNVSDIRVVGFMPKLVKLVMYRNHITDISPLKDCLELRALFMHENPIEDYAPLLHMSQLQYLHLTRDDFNKAKAQTLKGRLPETKIVYM